MKSSVSTGSVAAEHRSVAPATSTPSDVVGETADPEHRRVREEPRARVRGRGSRSASSRCPSKRAVLVDHALRRARRPRRVHDHHAVVGRDVVLDRVEHRVGHVGRRAPPARRSRRRARRAAGDGAAAIGRGHVRSRPDRVVERGDVVVARGTRARRAARSTSARASRSRSSRRRREGADGHRDRADAHRRQPRERRSRRRSGTAGRSGCRGPRPPRAARARARRLRRSASA